MFYIFDRDEGEYAYRMDIRELADSMVDYCVSQGDRRERYVIESAPESYVRPSA